MRLSLSAASSRVATELKTGCMDSKEHLKKSTRCFIASMSQHFISAMVLDTVQGMMGSWDVSDQRV